MRKEYSTVWPNAIEELSDKNAQKAPVELTYEGEQLEFTIKTITATPEGHTVELHREKMIALISTHMGADIVDIIFHSLGQPSER